MPSAGPIKLVAIDLDGTLLTSSKRVSEQTLNALRCLRPDVRVVIASARPPRSVRPIYQLLALDTWTINYNGALIWDEPGRQPVFHQPMSGALVRQIIETARDMFDEVLVSCEAMDRWFTDRADDPAYTTETGRLFAPDVVEPYQQFCQNEITKLMLLGPAPMLARLEPILLDRFGQLVTILHADEHLLQIMDRRVSKAAALAMVAEFYQVRRDQIMAIGDAPNDVGMLQYAGIAVAMDNAHPIVKRNAHWVAPSNDDHGVHAALLRYGLCR